MLSRQKVVANSTEVVVIDVTYNSIYEKLIFFPYTISPPFKECLTFIYK